VTTPFGTAALLATLRRLLLCCGRCAPFPALLMPSAASTLLLLLTGSDCLDAFFSPLPCDMPSAIACYRMPLTRELLATTNWVAVPAQSRSALSKFDCVRARHSKGYLRLSVPTIADTRTLA
jgi:hypothetical protein